MAEQINQVIDNLCARLGIAADYLFPLLVKQAKIDGCVSILETLFCILFLVGYGLMLKFLFKPRKDKNGDHLMEIWDCESAGLYVGAWVAIVILGIAAIFFLIAIPINISSAIKAFSNPEWYAIQELLKQVK